MASRPHFQEIPYDCVVLYICKQVEFQTLRARNLWPYPSKTLCRILCSPLLDCGVIGILYFPGCVYCIRAKKVVYSSITYGIPPAYQVRLLVGYEVKYNIHFKILIKSVRTCSLVSEYFLIPCRDFSEHSGLDGIKHIGILEFIKWKDLTVMALILRHIV